MYKRKIAEDKESRLIDTKALAAYLGIGYRTAAVFGREAGADIRIGSRLRFDRTVIDKKLDQMSGTGQTINKRRSKDE